MGMNRALIAFGGNLGAVKATLQSGRAALAELPDTKVIASSLLYRTAPVGPPGQPDYLNAVVSIETTFQPMELLATLHEIEHRHGRIRKEHWGARTLDLDLLAYDDLKIDEPDITIPHPRMAERVFVLRPLCDIAPEWQHPQLHRSAEELLRILLQQGEPDITEGSAW